MDHLYYFRARRLLRHARILVDSGYGFALMPIGVDALILTIVGCAFQGFSGHSYPHRAVLAERLTVKASPQRISAQDLERALLDMNEMLDVSPTDLDIAPRKSRRSCSQSLECVRRVRLTISIGGLQPTHHTCRRRMLLDSL